MIIGKEQLETNFVEEQYKNEDLGKKIAEVEAELHALASQISIAENRERIIEVKIEPL